MSCPTIRPPKYRQPMSLDTEALLASVSAAHLYTMPDTGSVHTALDLEGTLEVSERFTQPGLKGVNGVKMIMTE